MAERVKQANGKGKVTGICTTCRSLAGCALRRKGASPSSECEEFSSLDFATHARQKVTALRPVRIKSVARTAVPNAGLGLCVTCDALTACAFARTEGGVWSCEEYH